MKMSKYLASVSCVAFLAACQSSLPDYSTIRIHPSYIVNPPSGKDKSSTSPSQKPGPKPEAKPEVKPQPKPAQPAEPEKIPEEKIEEKQLLELVYGNPEIRGKPVVVNNVNALALEIHGYSGEQLYAVSLGKNREDYWVGTQSQIIQYATKDPIENIKMRAAAGVGSNVRLRIAKPSLTCNGNWIDISELELIVDNEVNK